MDSLENISSHEVPGPRKSCLNKYAFAAALLASTTSILLGYDIGVMSGAIIFIRENIHISTIEVELLVSSLNVCSLFGSLLAGRTSDLIGRRFTIVLAVATFFIGAVLMGFAPSYAFLMAGRVIAGIGVGYSLMIGPVYTTELSPSTSRGFLSSLPELFITIGILFGYLSNYFLAGLPNHINWRIMLGLAGLPAIAIGLGVLVMPESPRWLVMKGRFDEANKILLKTSDSNEEAELRLKEMKTAASNLGSQFSGKGVWEELLLRPSRSLRRILIAAIGINFFMQASGNDAVVYYSPEVFKAAGIHNKRHLFGITVVMGLSKTFFVLVSALFLDRFGRRPLLLIGTLGMVGSLVGLGLGSKFLVENDPKPTWAIVLSIIAVCADLSFFSIGLGPITWVYSSEIFPMKYRAQGTSIAVSVNRVVSGAVAMTFLTIANKITFAGVFFILAGIMTLATIFFYFFLPETKGKTLEEIEALFEDDKF
ncbi:polyol transporter 5-like [Durio zibethinus]|uniref:Polyol transporter 5-like n=1 Tax=Durio zibethinus TaxID=66656 RepID=A0A6P5XKV2_DURZI|nr:polyol transporter 5-like [Durio zibethinus]